jgi:hypothetical protein
MPALGAAIQALGMQQSIHLGGTGSDVLTAPAPEGVSERLGIRAPAFEAGAMPRRQRCHFVEEEQLGKTFR